MNDSTRLADLAGVAAAGSMSIWLPFLERVSALASMFVPILAAILLLIRIVVLVQGYRRGRGRGRR